METRIKPIKNQVYNLSHYGVARYLGIVNTDYGFIWNFYSLENNLYWSVGDGFSLPYNANGLLVIL